MSYIVRQKKMKTVTLFITLTVSAFFKGNHVQAFPYSEQDTDSLADELRELKSQLKLLKQKVNITEHEVEELKRMVVARADVPAVATPVVALVNEPSTTTSDPVIDISLDSEVGFSAKLSHELHDLSTFSVIKYDYVIFNAGNGYDSKTGIFTVPVEGMYMFTYFVEALGTQAAEIQLVVDGMIRFPAISEPESPGNDDTGGNMVIEHLVKGQQVWIETYETENQNIFPGFTTFSAALIP